MIEPTTDLKVALNRFEPTRTLAGEELQAFYQPREHSPLEPLISYLRFQEGPVKVPFMDHPRNKQGSEATLYHSHQVFQPKPTLACPDHETHYLRGRPGVSSALSRVDTSVVEPRKVSAGLLLAGGALTLYGIAGVIYAARQGLTPRALEDSVGLLLFFAGSLGIFGLGLRLRRYTRTREDARQALAAALAILVLLGLLITLDLHLRPSDEEGRGLPGYLITFADFRSAISVPTRSATSH